WMERVRCDIAILFDANSGPVAKCNLAEVATACCTYRPAFLLSSIHPIGELIVGDHVIELGRRLVVPGTPGLAAIHADGCALVDRNRDDFRVERIDPDGVIVVPAGRAFDCCERLTSIG